ASGKLCEESLYLSDSHDGMATGSKFPIQRRRLDRRRRGSCRWRKMISNCSGSHTAAGCRCLEMILTNPATRVLIACVGGDAPEIAPKVRHLMRERLIRSTPEGTAEGFDSVDKGTLMPGEKVN